MSWPLPETTVLVPLLAAALAITFAVPEAPWTHWTVTVPGPLATTAAIVVSSTLNCPVYGEEKVTGPLKGGRLNVPVAMNGTCPLGKLPASADCGDTAMDVRMRKSLGLFDPQDTSIDANRAKAITAKIGRERVMKILSRSELRCMVPAKMNRRPGGDSFNFAR
jgi:hypothetical protein